MENPSGLSPPILPAAPATMDYADWSSLPADLINRIADCFLATSGLDYYMDFHAVCQSWRSATVDPKMTLDPRFRPSHWVIVRKVCRTKTCLLSNTATGRFLRKELPLDYYVPLSTRDSLLVLVDMKAYQTVSVLNPFTGYMVRFFAPMLPDFVKSATLVSGSSPTLLLLCSKALNGSGTDLYTLALNVFSEPASIESDHGVHIDEIAIN